MNAYLLPPEESDWPALLENWGWLLPDNFGVRMVNSFGDVFIEIEDGTIALLDINAGSLLPLGENWDDFLQKLAVGENAAAWLYIPLVDALRAQGIIPPPGFCYAFARPPLLGGEYRPENVRLAAFAEHLAFTGDFCEQLRDVQDGAEVELKVRAEDYRACDKPDCCGGTAHAPAGCDHGHHHPKEERCRDGHGHHYAGCDGHGGCGGKGDCGNSHH